MKSMRRLLSLVLMIMLMLPLVPVPASAAYGVLFIPESAYDLELPDQNNAGPGLVKLNFDPFLGQMEGSRSWVHWDTSTILTECGGFMDLTYVCAVESEYPEGNYIVRCVAFYRNDAEKSLVSYHITYQTDETEYYVISYFGHHYREAMLAMTRAQLTKAETEKAQKEGKTTAQALQDKVVNLYNGTYDGTDTKIPDSKHKQVEIYKYDSDKKEYLEIKHDSSGSLPKDLTDPKVLKYYKTASWFTPTPDTIYAGTYMNGDTLLRNGSGKYLGTASWFEWDYDSGKVTMSKLDNLRRLYSFPSPRVRVRAEALDEGPVASEEEFYDGMDVVPETDAVDIIPEDATDGEPAAAKEAVLAQGFERIVRTGGRVTALPPHVGRKENLVEPDQLNGQPDRPRPQRCSCRFFHTLPVVFRCKRQKYRTASRPAVRHSGEMTRGHGA